MTKKLCKAAVCFCAAGLIWVRSFPAWGAWKEEEGRWQYSGEDGSLMRSVWHFVDGDWYRFDEDGFIKTGWYLDSDGCWYFLNPVSDGTKGRMMTGWQWIDGYCYYLCGQKEKSHPLGSMYADEETPDHYRVSGNGAWSDENGVLVYCPEKGIQTGRETGGNETGTPKTTGRSGSSRTGGVRGGGGSSKGAGGGGNAEGGNSKEAGGGGSSEGGNSKETGIGGETESSKEIGNSGENEAEYDEKTEGNGTQDKGTEDSKSPDRRNEEAGKEENIGFSGTAGEKVNWQVHFTDSAAHQLFLLPSKSGSAEDGANLTIYFQTQITDSQGHIWKSKQQSPYIISITGPQNRIIYIEYEQTGETGQEEEPWEEERKLLKECFDAAREEEGRFRGVSPKEIPDSAFLVMDRTGCSLRLQSAASRLRPGQEGTFYVIGKNYMPEGSALTELYGDEIEYSDITERQVTLNGDLYTAVRFQIVRKSEEPEDLSVWTGEEKRHWNVGDVQERTLDGTVYRFRCIDQNYGDETDRSRQKALFLCDSVIPADTGSEYVYEKSEDGTYEYRFCPGPIGTFGSTDSYRYSRIRNWLQACGENLGKTEKVPTGEAYAYEGSTPPGIGSRLTGTELKPVYLGKQSMTDNLFILSVDEALKYKQWLWRFEGAGEENPESQWGPFCESYWLRTSGYDRTEAGEKRVYVVDLVDRNIRPRSITVKENSEDEELSMTGTVGVRPVFAVRQY